MARRSLGFAAMLATLRRLSYRLDPGLQRTMAAGRTTVAVAVALPVALPLARALELPSGLAILLIAVAMNTSAALIAPSRRGRVRALGAAGAIALGAVALGLTLAGRPLASRTAFVGIMALGAWASGYGLQRMTLGLLAFQSYFFTLLVPLAPTELPWALAAAGGGVAIAGACALLVIISPRRRLLHLIASLRAQVATLRAVTTEARGRRDAGRTHREVRRAVTAIDDILVQVHEVLAQARDVVPDEYAFHRRLFAVVTLSHYLLLEVEAGDAAVDALHPPPSDPLARLQMHLGVLARLARGETVAASPAEGAAWLQERDVPRTDQPPEPALPTPATEPPSRWRLVVQATSAGVIAIAAGLVVAPERWYWAALSAYFVLLNTPSRAATLRKALERLIGTAAGAAIGLGAGAVLAQQTALELLAILPLVFTAFWLLQVSYAAMVAVFTVLVALLYELQGMLTVAAMAHRLVDTLLGALAGVVVAHLLVPSRTRAVVDGAFRHYLEAMRGMRTALEHAASLPPGQTDAIILRAARTLDQSVGALRRTLQPLAWSAPGRRRALRRQMTLALAARFWMHRAAAEVMFHRADDAGSIEEIAAVQRADRVLAELAAARAV